MTDAAVADILTLTQWLSPAYPVSAYAWSHGLEQTIAAGEIADAASLEVWVSDVLTHGAGWSDAVLLARARDRDADLAEIAALASALAPSRERHLETTEQGAAFARTTSALTGWDLPAMPYPVAVGAAARTLALPTGTVVAVYLHAFAANLVSAAVRFVPLGQTEGQATLAALHDPISELARQAAVAPLDSIGASAFRADIAAMHHETLTPRIFRS